MVGILIDQARTSFFLSLGLISLVAQQLFKTHQNSNINLFSPQFIPATNQYFRSSSQSNLG